jgi:dTMP kinase
VTARGRFITLEGGEGAGKSTQQRRLAAWLRDGGIDVTVTREPGGSPGAEEIRRLLVTGAAGRWDATTEALLHFAARRDHLIKTIEPALARGNWVVCDRFADSTMAYQGYGHGLGRAVVETLYKLVVGDVAPDLTLVLDLPVADGLARARARNGAQTQPHLQAEGEDRYEQMDLAFHERLREGFHDIVARAPERCLLIDAAGDEEAVAARIRAAVGERLGVAA